MDVRACREGFQLSITHSFPCSPNSASSSIVIADIWELAKGGAGCSLAARDEEIQVRLSVHLSPAPLTSADRANLHPHTLSFHSVVLPMSRENDSKAL